MEQQRQRAKIAFPLNSGSPTAPRDSARCYISGASFLARIRWPIMNLTRAFPHHAFDISAA
jgi:hypothetical protein